jgi:hypothetical protein
MDYFRSKRWIKEIEKTDLFFKQNSDKRNYYIETSHENDKLCYISKSIWDDIQHNRFIEQLHPNHHVQQFINYIFTNPIYDKILLEKRQKTLCYFYNNQQLPNILTTEISQRFDWLLNIDPSIKNYIMDVMFPKSWAFKWLYWDPLLLNSYHLYRAYWSPITQCIYPLSVIMGPYFYIYNKLQWKIAFKTYIKSAYRALLWIYKSSKDATAQIRNIIIFGIYIGIYLYNFIQVIDWSNQIRKYRNTLLSNLKIISNTVARFQIIIKQIPIDFWKPYLPEIERHTLLQSIPFTPKDFQNYWKNPNARVSIQNIYTVIGIYQGLCSVSSLLSKDWTLCHYNYPTTVFGSMKHPELIEAVANPICLSKNLIITGPNAAGKTTYVKSLLWNILFAQTFGIIRCKYGNTQLYEAILHHDRIKDVIGEQSLFQAEMYKAKEILTQCKKHGKLIYFMDEPFHSTPPLDGSAMLKAFMHYLSNYKNTQMILTTHYFTLQELEKILPNRFKNICMEAILQSDASYKFPYLIRKGYSKQSIGIELLKINDFPEVLIETALKMKNKIYLEKVNVP